MTAHHADHDPLLEHRRCSVCHYALATAFSMLADMVLGPASTEMLIRRLREAALESIEASA